MIVIDASVLVAFLLKEEGWEGLGEYLENSVSIDLVVKEAVNAIWKAYILKNIISRDIALKLYSILKSMIGVNIVLEPEDMYLDKALDISIEYRIPIYDSLYVAQALEKKLPLLTLDTEQAGIAREIGVEAVVPLRDRA